MQVDASAHRLRPAVGTLLGSNAVGDYVSNPSAGMSFTHPFKPALVGSGKGVGLRFMRGIVLSNEESFEPKIAGKPMSGGNGMLAPTLKLSYADVNKATNESWAVLEVTPNAKGLLDKNSKVQIVHRAAPGGVVGSTGLQPLALIVWAKKKPVAVWPLVFFNLRYVQKTSTSGPTRHYFL